FPARLHPPQLLLSLHSHPPPHPPPPPPIPTRRSSDLAATAPRRDGAWLAQARAALDSRPAAWASVTSQTRNRLHPAEVFRVLRRSEEHTSELQSPDHRVCRLRLEKEKLNARADVRAQE